MKKTAILLASTAAIIAVPAQAREGQLYAGLDAGVSLQDQADVDLAVTDPQTNAVFADTDNGFDFGAVLGYDFGAFRLEAEAAYKSQGYDSVTVADPNLVSGVPSGTVVSTDDDLNIFTGMINAIVEYGSDDGLQIFAGGGAGIGVVDGTVSLPGGTTLIDESSSDLAYQALAGLRFPVSDNVDLGVKYRYLVIDEFEVDSVSGSPYEFDYQVHSVLASVVYNFGGKAAPPPPPPPAPAPVAPPPAPTPPPPPPPAPAPACNTGPYIVFFDFDQSTITADAATILDNAITAYANCGNARVMLAGHTDRSGSVTYNMGLAERRNMSVRQYLTGRGIPAAQIMAEAFGESMPRVPTADGVRELQNRRVEVTYGPGSGM